MKMRTLRAKNLGLARDMNYGHKYTAIKLRGVVNACYLSKMVCGDMDIPDDIARRIEQALALPSGWLDRCNHVLLTLADSEFDMLQVLLRLSEPKQIALMRLLDGEVDLVAH